MGNHRDLYRHFEMFYTNVSGLLNRFKDWTFVRKGTLQASQRILNIFNPVHGDRLAYSQLGIFYKFLDGQILGISIFPVHYTP